MANETLRGILGDPDVDVAANLAALEAWHRGRTAEGWCDVATVPDPRTLRHRAI